MERDSIPTLTESETGWPVLTVAWGQGKSVAVEVCEETEGNGAVVVVRADVPVRVVVGGGVQQAAVRATSVASGHGVPGGGGGGGGAGMSSSSGPHYGFPGGGGR